jgi:hypothetical protein
VGALLGPTVVGDMEGVEVGLDDGTKVVGRIDGLDVGRLVG